MARRYPLRQRKPRQVWEPRPLDAHQADLRDTDWASDVDTACSSDEEILSDDSLREFVVSDNEGDAPYEPSEPESTAPSDDDLTDEESETISVCSDGESETISVGSDEESETISVGSDEESVGSDDSKNSIDTTGTIAAKT